MHSRIFATSAILLIWLTPAAWPKPAADLDAVLSRIDSAGAAFHGMSANLRALSHTAVINEDTVDSGTVLLKRSKPRDMRMLVDFTQPDPKTIAFQGRKVEIYYPKIQTVQEFDLGQNRDLVDQFFLLGFGTSRVDLQNAYSIHFLGPETLAGQQTERLELIPKSKAVLEHLKKFELWIADSGYPVQQKFYLPGGDYKLMTYSEMKINPELRDAALKLQVPKNVKREYPQK
jgi:outer membrane lipoprotein-sorting protein